MSRPRLLIVIGWLAIVADMILCYARPSLPNRLPFMITMLFPASVLLICLMGIYVVARLFLATTRNRRENK